MYKKYFVAFQILKSGQPAIYGSTVLTDLDSIEPEDYFKNISREIAKRNMVLPDAVIITAFNRVN